MSGRWYVEQERRFIGLGHGITPLLWSAYYSDGPGFPGAFLGAYPTRKSAEAALEKFRAESPEGYATVTWNAASLSMASKPKGKA